MKKNIVLIHCFFGLILGWVVPVWADSERSIVLNNNDSYPLLKLPDSSRTECGTDDILNLNRLGRASTIVDDSSDTWASQVVTEDRIKDCSKIPGSSKKPKDVQWNLVSRKWNIVSLTGGPSSGGFYEVWQDSMSGLIWGDRLDGNYNYFSEVGLTPNGALFEEKVCNSKEGKRANCGIQDQKFGLPTIEEFKTAEEHGIREVLPNMAGNAFWASSQNPSGSYVASFFNGEEGDSFYIHGPTNGDYSVRCVSRRKR